MSSRKNVSGKKQDKFAAKPVRVILPGQPLARAMSAGQALSLAASARERQQWPLVLGICEQLVQQLPRFEAAWLALFDASHRLGDFAQLEQLARKAVEAQPRWTPGLVSLATALRLQRRHDEALPLLEKARQLQPADPAVTNHLGILHKELGQPQLALQSFNRCIALRKDFGEAYWNRSDLLCEPKPDDIEVMQTLLADASLTDLNRARLHYALARAWEFLGDPVRQFTHVAAGARCKRDSIDYDHAAEMQLLQRIEPVFCPEVLGPADTPAAVAAATSTPVFICGLPRSGTTLAEQILSSHPLVTAGDELMDLPLACNRQLQQLHCGQPFPDWAADFSAHDWASLGKRYLDSTRELHGTPFFTDKNLLNFRAIGVIHRALPQAKIVYCERDPMDNLWGCLRQLFGDGLYFTYSQLELADTWNATNRLMRYWQQQLPGRIHVLRYEQLLDDQADTTRRLLDFIGLPWHEGCLQFYRNKRAVRTTSSTQVRSPLANSRVGQWRRFAEQLQPMRERLLSDAANSGLY